MLLTQLRYVPQLLLLFLPLLLLGPSLAGAAASSQGASFYQNKPGYSSPTGNKPLVLRHFEKPPQKWLAGHRGVDLALEAGAPLLAPAAGEVVFAGRVVDRTVLTIRHEDGKLSSFEPVTDPLPRGSRVERGQQVALLDGEIRHCAPASCLHWGVRLAEDDYINPLTLLGLEEPSILLPLGQDFSASPPRVKT